MSTKGKRVIYVGQAGGNNGKPLNVEGVAVAATAPGTLMTNSASGLSASTNAATVFGTLPLFADKDQQRSKSVDDAWTINENMVAIQARSGEFLNVLVATGQTLAIGDPLVSDGAGLLTKGTGAGTQHVVANADEAVTTSGTTLVRVRIV
jgi:hypothetical protein